MKNFAAIYHLEDHHNALADTEACVAIAIKLNLGSKSMIQPRITKIMKKH